MQAPVRRGQATDDPVAPSTNSALWSASGGCFLRDDGCVTSNVETWPPTSHTCSVAIDPVWTGVVFVEYMHFPEDETFFVDGEPVNQAVHGTAPRDTLVWSGGGNHYGSTWKICQWDALPPWEIIEGTCYIDYEGCLASEYYSHVDSFNGHSTDICDQMGRDSGPVHCVMNLNNWQVSRCRKMHFRTVIQFCFLAALEGHHRRTNKKNSPTKVM